MAMLINGSWDPDAKGTTAPDGSFIRAESPYRDFITAPNSGKFPAEEKPPSPAVRAGQKPGT